MEGGADGKAVGGEERSLVFTPCFMDPRETGTQPACLKYPKDCNLSGVKGRNGLSDLRG